MNNKKKPNKTTFSIKLEPELHSKLCTYAQEHKWSKNVAVNDILTQFLMVQS